VKTLRSNFSSMMCLSRPWAWISIVLLVTALKLDLPYTGPMLLEAMLSGFAVALIVAGGFSLNDYADRNLDVYAHPDRPIPAGRLSAHVALKFALSVFLIGLLLLAHLGILHLTFGLIAVAMLVVYSPLKNCHGLGGNITVALLLSLAVLYGYLAGNHSLGWIPTLLLASMVFFAIFAREIVKDVEDMNAETGWRTTLPTQFGHKTAYRVAGLFIVLSLILCLMFFGAIRSNVGLASAILASVYSGLIMVRLLDAGVEASPALVGMMKVKMLMILGILVVATL